MATHRDIILAVSRGTLAPGAALDHVVRLLDEALEARRDAEHAAARAGAEAGALRVEVRRLCAQLAELEGRAAA